MASSWPTHRARARRQRQYGRWMKRQQRLARRAAARGKAPAREARV